MVSRAFSVPRANSISCRAAATSCGSHSSRPGAAVSALPPSSGAMRLSSSTLRNTSFASHSSSSGSLVSTLGTSSPLVSVSNTLANALTRLSSSGAFRYTESRGDDVSACRHAGIDPKRCQKCTTALSSFGTPSTPSPELRRDTSRARRAAAGAQPGEDTARARMPQ